MRVEDKQSVKGAEPAPPRQAGDRGSVVQPDKVSVDAAKHVQAVVQAVQANLGVNRAARLQELENAIRRGGYQPDAGQLAEKIVQAAEIDARISAILGG